MHSNVRQFVVLLATILGATVIIPGCAPQNSVYLSDLDGVEVKTTDPLEAFQGEYQAISEKADEGTLPAETLSRAAEIRMGLEKYLIKTESQLKILRLDLLHGHDGARQTALEEILVLVAERERTKMAYLKRLQALNASHRVGENGEKNAKFKDIEIEIGPEDITEGERP